MLYHYLQMYSWNWLVLVFLKDGNTKINEHEFIRAIQFVMLLTYFTFNNVIYKRIFGALIDSPLSPIIADLTMQNIEIKALDRIKYSIPIYFRYVDDILLAVPNDKINETVSIINSFQQKLQFTHKIQTNSGISFLDLRINLINNVVLCITN